MTKYEIHEDINIVERSSGFWIVDNHGIVVPKPYTSLIRARQGLNVLLIK